MRLRFLIVVVVFPWFALGETPTERAEQLHKALFAPEPAYGQMEEFVGDHLFAPDWVQATRLWAAEYPDLAQQGETRWNAHWAELDQEIRRSHPLWASPFLGAMETLDVAQRPAQPRLYTHQEADLQARNELGLGNVPLQDGGLKHRYQKRVTQLMEQENPLKRGAVPDSAERFQKWKQNQTKKWELAALELHRQVAVGMVRDLGFEAYLAKDWLPAAGEKAHLHPKVLSPQAILDLSLRTEAPETIPHFRQAQPFSIPGTANHTWEVLVQTPEGERHLILRPKDHPAGATFGYLLENFGQVAPFDRLGMPAAVFTEKGHGSMAWFARAQQTLELLQEGLEELEAARSPSAFRQKLQDLHQRNSTPPNILARMQSEPETMGLLWAQGPPSEWIRERDRQAVHLTRPPLDGRSQGLGTDVSGSSLAKPSNTTKTELAQKKKRAVFEVHGSGAPRLFEVPSREDRARSIRDWERTGKEGTVKVESLKFFPLQGDRLGLLLPEGMELADIEVWDGTGKEKKLGVDFTVEQVEGGRGLFLKCPGCETLAYRAEYAPLKTPRPTLPEDLRQLDKTIVAKLAKQLEADGFTALSQKIESLLWWRSWGNRKVSVQDLAQVFRAASRYSYHPEKPAEAGESPFSSYRGFLNERGEMCAQCDGTNGLFSTFLEELFRQSGKKYQTEVRTFYVRDGDHLSESLHGVTKVFGSGLEGFPLDATPQRMDTRPVRSVPPESVSEDARQVRQASIDRESPTEGQWEQWVPELERHREATRKSLSALFQALEQSGLGGSLRRGNGPLEQLIRLAGLVERSFRGPLGTVEWEGEVLSPRQVLDRIHQVILKSREALEKHVPGRDKKFPVYSNPHVRAALDGLSADLGDLAQAPGCGPVFSSLSPH